MKLLHALMAAALTIALGLTLGAWWPGAAAAGAYFVGREIAQAEYRWIERHGDRLRANMPALAVLTDPRGVWSEKSWLWDAALPCVLAALLAWYGPALLEMARALT
jgi:hypothetical protein